MERGKLYFLAFQADFPLAEVARELTASLDPARDMLVVGVVGTQDVVWFGQLQHPAAFAALFPEAARLGDVKAR